MLVNYDVIGTRSSTTKYLPTEKSIRTMYQRNVDVDMLNAVKSMLTDVSSWPFIRARKYIFSFIIY